MRSAPLRFLALVLGGWICVRAAILAPGWWPGPRATADRGAAPGGAKAAFAPVPARPAGPAPADTPGMASTLAPAPTASANRLAVEVPVSPVKAMGARSPSTEAAPPAGPYAPPAARPAARADSGVSALRGSVALPSRSRNASRWSGSAWLLLRDDRGRASLAPGGALGGSQAGAKLHYRVGGALALSARLYAPLRRIGGAEAAAGIDWQPWSRLSVHVLAERRQKLGNEGRSAFALTLYGGLGRRLPGGLRGDAYLQAGVVGLRSRDLFVDGSVRATLPVGPIELGAAAWGAAQPGAARLDAGPSVSYRLPVGRATLRLQADWRFRVAGDAAPGSGPALTLAADF